ncbi:MAG: NAD(P)/FAD-dependent oxidoreductase [Chloroflexota bacterium]
MTRTIVIGAGMAGIMAARTLHDAGHAVKILEARNRVGGRTHTDHSLGVSVDLGGSWIHGAYANPLTELARTYNIATGYTDFVDASGSAILAFDADGTPLDRVEYAQGLQLASGAMAHAYGSLQYALPEATPAYDSYQALHEIGLPIPDNLTPTQRKGYYYASIIRAQYSAAADTHEMAWRVSNDYIRLPGGDQLVYGGGYNAITDRLAEGLTIETETIVSRIVYDNDGVTIHARKAGKDVTMHCEHVIITVPLGVLKAGVIDFAPALPQTKTDAIERIGFGNYEKIVFRFPEFFWPREFQRFNYLPGGIDPQEPELFTSWLNNGHYTGEPVIVAYHAGSRAQVINEMSDSELIETAMSVLTKLFGDRVEGELPAPVSYVRTGWSHDPHCRGSYSFDKVGQQAGDRRALAASVANRLFFAGEATHPHYHSTVHGAYETGIRAAQEVMAVQ